MRSASERPWWPHRNAIDHLWDDVERIDVIYVCSNGSIAQQNIGRLNVLPDQGFSFSSRMAMIARQVAQLSANRVNFVSFTPGTSFDLKSSVGLRRRVEAELSKVMVRTERLGAPGDRNGMLTEFAVTAPLEPGDVSEFVSLEAAASVAGAQGMVEYWKSVPSFINFCDGYKADDRIAAALADPTKATESTRRLRAIEGRIDWSEWRRFGSLDPGNGRYRILEEQTVENEAWRMLWIAPSLPYHSLGGPWEGERSRFTKRLIFSSWAGVPKSVSSLLSYEVERRMFGLRPDPIENSPEARRTIRGLLPFRRDTQGRPGAMNSFAFVYPCVTLARIADPLAVAREQGKTLSLDEMRATVGERITAALEQIEIDEDASVPGDDPRWYWAAPLLLDGAADAAPWMAHRRRYRMSWLGGAAADDDDVETASHEIFDEHIDLPPPCTATRSRSAASPTTSSACSSTTHWACPAPMGRSVPHRMGIPVPVQPP